MKHLLWLHGVYIVHVRVGIFACLCVCVCGTYVRLHVRNYAYGIVSVKRDLMHGFSRFQI